LYRVGPRYLSVLAAFEFQAIAFFDLRASFSPVNPRVRFIWFAKRIAAIPPLEFTMDSFDAKLAFEGLLPTIACCLMAIDYSLDQ
jgi:hypothetical protein